MRSLNQSIYCIAKMNEEANAVPRDAGNTAAVEKVPETLQDAFESLEFRFLDNIPNHELESAERLFFHLEQAHWFYEDFLADNHDHLRHFHDFKVFAQEMFNRCEILEPVRPHFRELYEEFRAYRARIPVFGLVLLNKDMSRVLLVQSYKGRSWGFPKGKVNENEDEVDCAVREVYEEIGYDCKDMVNPEDFVETNSKQGKRIKLFIIRGIDENFDFHPRVRKEIAGVQFFNVSELPASKNESSTKFWSLHTFTPQLLKWIQKQKAIDRRSRSAGKSRGATGPSPSGDNANSNSNNSGKKSDKKKNKAAAAAAAKANQQSQQPKQQQQQQQKQQQKSQGSTRSSNIPQVFSVDVDAVMAAMRPYLQV